VDTFKKLEEVDRTAIKRSTPKSQSLTLAPEIFSLSNSSTPRIGTVRLPDRNIPLEWTIVPYYKSLVRNLASGERCGHVPEPSQKVLLQSSRKP
jgi:hypothetical protein